MASKRRPQDSVPGLEAEAEFRALCKRLKVSGYNAMLRIGMGQATPWRWKNEGINPEPWRVNLLSLAVLELAEEAGSLDDAAREELKRLRAMGLAKPGPSIEAVENLRARLTEMEQRLKAKEVQI